MKVEVDDSLCIGSGNCVDTCPKVFELVDGISQVKVDAVPAGEEGNVREAVDGCPVTAITITEE